MRILTILFLTFCTTQLIGQSNEQQIEQLQDQIAKSVGELKKLTSVNYMKHFNQVQGFKHGLWIESTNGELWFANYDTGLKHGELTIYYTSGKKYIEATYDQGTLTGKVTFYDTRGGLLQTYERIEPNDTIVERPIEKVEGKSIYFTKEKHRYDYRVYVKKYMSSGVLYKEGYGLVDDDWILTYFSVGEWQQHE
ncbi:MAG: hypothetical protein KI790_16595 [Cyclobacteriaceae bacterium]|nr:hypothetical protein [Cyclobacteriaceae bacterium HetDA_MAG_MS6]